MNKTQKIFSLSFLLLLALIPISAVSVPRGAAFLPALTAVLFLIFYPRVYKEKPVFSNTTCVITLGISILCALSSLWAINPHESLTKASQTGLSLLFGGLLISAAQTVKIDDIKSKLWLLPASLCLSSILIFIDLKFGAPFYRLLRHLPSGSYVKPAEFNRAAVVVGVLFFPCMAILRHYLSWPKTFALIAVTIGPMLVITDSQSTQMALILGLVTMLAFPYRWKPAWYAAIAGICALMIAAPFLSIWIFDHMAKEIDSVPMMGHGGAYAGARLEIWDYVSRYMLQRPLIGFGFEATREVVHFDSHEIYQAGTTILHPHNFVIQIWMEFGFIGIMIAAGLMAVLLLTMQKKLNIAQARFTLPALIACMSVASTGYGLWQGWWIGTLITVAAVCILAIRMDQHKLSTLNHNMM